MASSAPVIEHAQHLLSQVDTTKLLDHPYASTAVVGVVSHTSALQITMTVTLA
jgi:hypothetical protein